MTMFTTKYFLGVFVVFILAETIDSPVIKVRYFSAILTTITPT